jgi:hypothetical protein
VEKNPKTQIPNPKQIPKVNKKCSKRAGLGEEFHFLTFFACFGGLEWPKWPSGEFFSRVPVCFTRNYGIGNYPVTC